jgi:ankyrin repeat protein
MSAKESAGFKLLVVVGIGAVLGGAALAKQRLSADKPHPAPTTTAQSAELTPSAAPAASSSAAPAPPKPTSSDRAALLEAAGAGDLPKVQALHEKGVALAGTLAPAARSGNVALVTWLIDHGVDVHEDEDSGVPPLVESEDHEGVVALLLARGVKEPDLVRAVHAQAPKTVARLLSKKADPNAKASDGDPVLHAAIVAGEGAKRTAIVKSLLDAGAQPDAPGAAGDTPLDSAIHQAEAGSDGAVDVVKLLAAKAPIDRDAMMIALGMRSDRKAAVLDAILAGKVPPETAYRGVALATDPKLVARIAAKGVAWGTKDPYVEEPPLLVAARKLDVELVKALLAAGAPVEGGDELGDTPLLTTIDAAPPDSDGAATIVSALLAKGANANRRAKDGRRPLHVAAERGEEAIVKALLAKGAHVDDEVNGTSPLEAAESNGHREVAKILLAKGAKRKAPPKD